MLDGFIDEDVRRKREWWGFVEYGSGLIPLPRNCSINYGRDAKVVADIFYDYFNSPEGEVPWLSEEIEEIGLEHVTRNGILQNTEQGTPIHIPIYKATHYLTMTKHWKRHL